MNGDSSSEVSFPRMGSPALFLALAFNLLLLYQLHSAWIATSNYRQQSQELSLQIAQASVNAESAKTMQSLLERLANEMLFLAESDADLQRLVQKYQITRRNPSEKPPPSR
jgi:RNase adaptor protein for sRNA GlmZ degradation